MFIQGGFDELGRFISLKIVYGNDDLELVSWPRPECLAEDILARLVRDRQDTGPSFANLQEHIRDEKRDFA